MRLCSDDLYKQQQQTGQQQNAHFQNLCLKTITGHMTGCNVCRKETEILSHSIPLNVRLGTAGKYHHVLRSQAEVRGGASRSQDKYSTMNNGLSQ